MTTCCYLEQTCLTCKVLKCALFIANNSAEISLLMAEPATPPLKGAREKK